MMNGRETETLLRFVIILHQLCLVTFIFDKPDWKQGSCLG